MCLLTTKQLKSAKQNERLKPDMSPLNAHGLNKKLVLLLGFELLIKAIWISQKMNKSGVVFANLDGDGVVTSLLTWVNANLDGAEKTMRGLRVLGFVICRGWTSSGGRKPIWSQIFLFLFF